MEQRSGVSKPRLYFWIFVVAAITGWIYEEIFYYATEGLLEKRGFLYGVYLPVYGVGALAMLLLLGRFKNRPVLFFVLAMVVTGVLEYVTGAAMYAIWHRRWWDYTGLFLNIGGHVCLRSVLTFGIGGLLLLYLVEPAVRHILTVMPKRTATVLTAAMAAILVVDTVCSFLIRN